MHDTGLAAVVAAILLITRLLIAVLFIRAALAKLTDIPGFREAVTGYEIVPTALTGVAAFGLLTVEAVAGLLLLLGVVPVVTSAALAALLTGFSAAIAVNLARGRIFDCGCGGTSAAPRLISWRHVVVNLLLAGAAAAVSVAPPAGLSLLPGPGGMVSIGIPGGSRFPILLTAVAGFLITRVLGAALTVRGSLRAPRGA